MLYIIYSTQELERLWQTRQNYSMWGVSRHYNEFEALLLAAGGGLGVVEAEEEEGVEGLESMWGDNPNANMVSVVHIHIHIHIHHTHTHTYIHIHPVHADYKLIICPLNIHLGQTRHPASASRPASPPAPHQ